MTSDETLALVLTSFLFVAALAVEALQRRNR